MTTLVTSPEFWSREAYRAKIKTPFEVVVSACARSTAASRDAPAAGRRLPRWRRLELRANRAKLGQPLYEGAAAYRLSRSRRIVGEHRRAARPA
jgi:hypothetical protein